MSNLPLLLSDFLIERELTQEQMEIQSVTRKYVEDRIKPNIKEWFESGDLPIVDDC